MEEGMCVRWEAKRFPRHSSIVAHSVSHCSCSSPISPSLHHWTRLSWLDSFGGTCLTRFESSIQLDVRVLISVDNFVNFEILWLYFVFWGLIRYEVCACIHRD